MVSRTAAPPPALTFNQSTLGSVPALGTTTLRLDEVYRDHASFVWRVLRGMGVPDAAIEDAVQDVFLVVHRRLADFDGRHPVKTWIFAIAQRIALEQSRKHVRSLRQDPLDERMRDRGESPEHMAEKSEAARLLARLLEGMADEKRAVLVLAEIEGLSVPEIAVIVDAPVNTVYTRLRRARLELNAALKAWRGRER